MYIVQAAWNPSNSMSVVSLLSIACVLFLCLLCFVCAPLCIVSPSLLVLLNLGTTVLVTLVLAVVTSLGFGTTLRSIGPFVLQLLGFRGLLAAAARLLAAAQVLLCGLRQQPHKLCPASRRRTLTRAMHPSELAGNLHAWQHTVTCSRSRMTSPQCISLISLRMGSYNRQAMYMSWRSANAIVTHRPAPFLHRQAKCTPVIIDHLGRLHDRAAHYPTCNCTVSTSRSDSLQKSHKKRPSPVIVDQLGHFLCRAAGDPMVRQHLQCPCVCEGEQLLPQQLRLAAEDVQCGVAHPLQSREEAISLKAQGWSDP